MIKQERLETIVFWLAQVCVCLLQAAHHNNQPSIIRKTNPNQAGKGSVDGCDAWLMFVYRARYCVRQLVPDWKQS